MTWLELVVGGLACFRLAVLLSHDDGPWGMFRRLRSFLKREAKHNTPLRRSEVHKGIECIKCDSLWFAVPVALYGAHRNDLARWAMTAGDVFLLCMALSALAILLNRAFPHR